MDSVGECCGPWALDSLEEASLECGFLSGNLDKGWTGRHFHFLGFQLFRCGLLFSFVYWV